ncbi:MAG: methionine ABC transporter ATP-binding protein [Erysipelotrichaceae bacterium]
MIEIKQVNKTYASNGLHALKSISLSVKEREIFGLIGMSGAGKSTILRVLSLLETYDDGEVWVDGKELRSIAGKEQIEYHKKMSVIFQGYNLLQQKTVYQNIALPLVFAKKSKSEIDVKVKSLIQLVGLQGKEHEYVTKISGGQKQRVAIARALVSDPKILLCDEPTSALDSLTTGEVLKLLKEINETLNVTILLITHEMGVVSQIVDRVAVINDGVIVECGEKEAVFQNPQHAITKLLLGKE